MKLRAKDFASSLWLILGIIVALIIIINDWVRAASIAVNAVGLVIVYASRPRRPILFVLFGILYLVTWPVIIGRALARHHTFDAICFSLLAVGAFIWLGIYCGIFFNRR
jgi:hypothetical protein